MNYAYIKSEQINRTRTSVVFATFPQKKVLNHSKVYFFTFYGIILSSTNNLKNVNFTQKVRFA